MMGFIINILSMIQEISNKDQVTGEEHLSFNDDNKLILKGDILFRSFNC